MVVALTTAACLRPSETTCESGTVCPDGYACRADGGCLSPAQLAACDGHADGDACELPGLGTGRCQDGGCVVESCGNGIVDPGEVCDDGNAEPGDGCSETCRSAETCGNGVVDVAAGESCDCGTDAAPSPGCQRGNSDDVDAECSASCALRRCGDGALGGVEECDVDSGGALLLRAPLDCGSFGYYAGELGCSGLCRIDLSACSSRCGDGVVDAAAGEACDGAAFVDGASCADLGWYAGEVACSAACQLTAAGSTCAGRCGDGEIQADAGELCDTALPGAAAMCADVGFDAGVAGCAAGCGLALTSCERFGWDHPVPVADVRQLWAEGDLLAYEDYISETWTGVVHDGDRVVAAPAYTYRLDGAGDVVYAVNAYDESFARFTRGDAGFVALAARPAGQVGGQVLALAADEALATYGFGVGGAGVWRYAAGAWSQDLVVGAQVVLTSLAKDATYAYALGLDYGPYRGVVYRRPRSGGAWTRFTLPITAEVTSITTRADGAVFVGAGDTVYQGLEAPVPLPGVSSARIGGPLGIGVVGSFYQYPAGYQAAYLGTLGYAPLQTPPGMLWANGTNVFTLNNGVSSAGAYQSRRAFWSAQLAIDATAGGDTMAGASASPGSVVMWSGRDLVERRGLGLTTVVADATYGVSAACRVGSNLYQTTDYDAAVGGGAVRIIADGGGVTTLAVGRAPTVVCLAGTGEALVVSIDAIARGTGAALTVTWVDNTFFNFRPLVAANATGEVYAAHRYGQVYRLDGTTFTPVVSLEVGAAGCSAHPAILGCIEGLFVDDAGAWTVITRDHIYRADGVDVAPDTLDGAGLRAVFGSGPDDVWAVGGVEGAWASIWHWDGGAWSKVAAPLDEPFYAGAAAADEVVLVAADRTISLIRP